MTTTSLEELHAFTAVYESGSFTAAARRLDLSTNAVSLRVQRLEATLGVRLFTRTTRSVTPTYEGRTYHQRISGLLQQLEHAAEELRPPDGGLHGTVRCAIPAVVASPVYWRRLRALLDAHPHLTVQTRVTHDPVNLAADGLDLALVIGPPPVSTFVGQRLGQVSWVLAATPAYLERHGRPTTPAELAQHRCLRHWSSPPQDSWTLVDRRGLHAAVRIGGGFEADDSRLLGEALYEGLGIGVRPARECAKAERAGTLERVLRGYRFEPLDVFVVVPKGRLRVPRVAACVAVLRAAVRSLA